MTTVQPPGAELELHRFPDIERLPRPYQIQLLRQSRVMRYADGETLFHAGDVDDDVCYLVEGAVVLVGSEGSVREIRGADPEARAPLDPSQPRRYVVRAAGTATVLQVKRSLLERLTTLAALRPEEGVEVTEITNGDPGNWMTRIAHSPLFVRLPSSNLLTLFERSTLTNVSSGDLVITQGTPPSPFYVIQEGVFRMQRTLPDRSAAIDLGELRPGDSFGAEALLTNQPHAVSISAATDGTLVRIGREDFLRHVVEPVLQSVTHGEADEMTKTGAQWLDVRPANAPSEPKIPQALHIPLEELRLRARKLPKDTTYIVTADNETHRRAAAFTLLESGHEARYLTDAPKVAPARPGEETQPGTQPLDLDTATSSNSASGIDALMADIRGRIQREIDMEVRAIKERCDRDLAERVRRYEQAALDQVRRKTAEIETHYQLMSARKEQALRKYYQRVLAMAESVKRQFDDLHRAQSAFGHLLEGGSTGNDSGAQTFSRPAGE